ncbi:OprD family outer membrane porin [Rahnella sp. BCC 1045]|uniref:OprD family outer membrane porin n=1 Tax=Rahnella sp. BCC 1045 TaxID=2816251 RepID=UPI001C2553E4|nr:OprD family outer membrane porin [Rahnella sp. BCC 1045]MBU9822010.1 OprD family outer membrane porin [Rahnella sp. BCC 1045]
MEKHALALITGILCSPSLAFAGIDDLAETGFIKNSSLDLGTHNIWKYLDEGETDKRNVHSAWGQGLALDYKSGYLADAIGVDASYYGVIKLAAADNFASRGILYDDDGQAKGFNKLGQFFGKAKFSQSGVEGNLYGGWKLIKLGVLTTSMRAASNTYNGWSGDLTYDAYRLRLAYLTKSLNRDSPDKVNFMTSDGHAIDTIYTGDVQFKTDNLTALYFYGESEDYLRRNGLELNLKQNKSLSYGVQIYMTQALDKWDSMANNKKDFDHRANHYAADMTWKYNDWTTKGGLAYTDANKEGGIGMYPRHMSKNSRGTFNSMTTAGLDYMRDEEKVLSLDVGYHITPELVLGINTHYGFFDFQGQPVKEGELNVYTLWKPASKKLKDLSVFAMIGPGRTYEHKGTSPIVDHHGNIKSADSFAAEFRLDYKFNIF